MKTWVRDTPYLLHLDSENVDEDSVVTITIADEGGVMVNDNTKDPIVEKSVSWDDTNARFQISLTLDPDTPTGFLRVFWYAAVSSSDTTQVTLEDQFTPEDYQLMTVSSGAIMPRIVPVSWFIDSFIAAESKMDSIYKRAVQMYVNSNYKSIDQALMAAQGNLEYDVKTFFFPRQETMKRDFYNIDFRENFWFQQTNYRPIITVDSYQLVFGANGIDITSELAPLVMIDEMMGTIEFLPTTVISGNLLAALMVGLNQLGITVLNDGSFSRVPLLFNITYTAGLNFPKLAEPEKESIRRAVAKSAFIELAPLIDPLMRQPSLSRSVDGASRSQSGGLKDLLKQYQEDIKKWRNDMTRKYGTDVDMAVV